MKTLLSWVLGLATLAGAIALWWSKKNQISSLQDALEVQRIKQTVARNDAKVVEALRTADAFSADIVKLREEIEESEQRAATILAGGSLEGKTGREIAKLFSDAGF